MGHLDYELFSWVYWPSNMDGLMKKHGYSSIHGFPSSASDTLKAESYYGSIKEKWKSVERDLLEQVEDEDEQERLYNN